MFSYISHIIYKLGAMETNDPLVELSTHICKDKQKKQCFVCFFLYFFVFIGFYFFCIIQEVQIYTSFFCWKFWIYVNNMNRQHLNE